MLCLQHCCHPLARGQQAAPAYRIVVLFIHSARSATGGKPQITITIQVSIHALLAECDVSGSYKHTKPGSFNPRTPCGVRLEGRKLATMDNIVSIHALLAECDPPDGCHALCTGSFNPRTPCGVRQSWSPNRSPESRFQSTHSLRSATSLSPSWAPDEPVSIHALLAECDSGKSGVTRPAESFNPRTPCGVRPTSFRTSMLVIPFQSTHSLRSATMRRFLPRSQTWRFNPRTPCGVRQCGFRHDDAGSGFNPRTPCGVRRCDIASVARVDGFQSTHSLRSATPEPSTHGGR